MEVFAKIKGSRTKVNEKSVRVGDIYFNKTDVFSKEELDEVMTFVKEKCPELLGGNTYYVNNYEHLLGNSKANSQKFFYVLSCMVDEKGNPIFLLVDENGLVAIKYVSTGEAIGEDVEEGLIGDEPTEPTEEGTPEPTEEGTTGTTEEGTEEGTTGTTEEGTTGTTEEGTTGTTEEGTPSDNVGIDAELKNLYTVDELKVILENLAVTDLTKAIIKKMKENELVVAIMENTDNEAKAALLAKTV
jgi:hypothetical protein